MEIPCMVWCCQYMKAGDVSKFSIVRVLLHWLSCLYVLLKLWLPVLRHRTMRQLVKIMVFWDVVQLDSYKG
jgi:hypothetical protein